jgi:hypothetical protein
MNVYVVPEFRCTKCGSRLIGEMDSTNRPGFIFLRHGDISMVGREIKYRGDCPDKDKLIKVVATKLYGEYVDQGK